jgi:hypothetical protein
MVKKIKRCLMLALLLLITMAGCAVSPDNSAVQAGNHLQEQDGLNTEEVIVGEDIEIQEESVPEKADPLGANSQADDASSAVQGPPEQSRNISESRNSSATVKLIISRDFGQRIILQETADIVNGGTVMDLLADRTKVETSYGGGFIASINGLKNSSAGLNGQMQDWFYFVNGICSDVGGADYLLRPGEVIWWDYHPWKAGLSNSAVIGCYPEPFLHGYRGEIRPTIIMGPPDRLDDGYKLEKALKAKGVGSIKVMTMDEALLLNRQGPTIVLGEWEKISGVSYIEDLNQAGPRNGTGIHFVEDRLELLNFQGQTVRSLDKHAGVIAAVGSGLGDTSPLWLVSGTDLPGFQQALDILISSPDQIEGKYNAAISGTEVIALPLNQDK